MRKYKNLTIPPREPRNSECIETKQGNYCFKTDCEKTKCVDCLFFVGNSKHFKDWYLAKNKQVVT